MLGFPRTSYLNPNWMNRIDKLFLDDCCSNIADNCCSFSEKDVSIDIEETDEGFVVIADMPGVQKSDLNITLEQGILKIAGERSEKNEKKDKNFCIQERSLGKFSRSFRLPSDINEESIDAHLKNGVLAVELKREKIKTHEIPIKS